MRRRFWFVIVCAATVTRQGLLAEAAGAGEAARPAVDLRVDLVSNVLWRGYDVHANRAKQRSQSYGFSTGEAAIQPSFTFHFPEAALRFNVFGSFALHGRNDVDEDHLLQAAPADPARELPRPAGFYAEPNGLARADAVHFTLAWQRGAAIGDISAGLVSHTNPNLRTKDASGDPQEEIFFSFAPSVLRALSASVWVNLNNSDIYARLAYGRSIDTGVAAIRFEYELSGAYGVQDFLQDWQDAGLRLGFSYGGFSLSGTLVYRPQLAFFDEDTAREFGGAYWLSGASSRGDGLVADPARTNGPWNRALNQELTRALAAGAGPSGYVYQPRQKLPRTLGFLQVGYQLSL